MPIRWREERGTWTIDVRANGRRKRLTMPGHTSKADLKKAESALYLTLSNMAPPLDWPKRRAFIGEFVALRPAPTGSVDPELVAKRLWRSSIAGARSRRLTYFLNVDSILGMLERSGGRCELSGIPFVYGRIQGKRTNPYQPSIDRISSSFGYTTSNCRIVLLGVNYARNEFGDAFFGDMISGICRHGVLQVQL